MATETIDDVARFEDTPEGWYRRLMVELQAAKDTLQPWRDRAAKTVARFLDERDEGQETERHLNLFTNNVQTLRAMLYGKVPNVDVSRRFGDAKDDPARVSAEILER